MRDFYKKEKPLQGMTGWGGGATGLRMAGGVVPDGQSNYITGEGTFSWVCPDGVESVSVVCIGAGGGGGGKNSGDSEGGGGGACSYKNQISVTPGTSYTVVVGQGAMTNTISGTAVDGGDSYFINASTVMAKGGGTNAATAGANGYQGGAAAACVGDGAYSGGDGANTAPGHGKGGEGSSSNGGNGGGTFSGGTGGNGGGGGGGQGSGGYNGTGGGASANGQFIGAGGGGGGGNWLTGSGLGGAGGGGGGNPGTVTGTSCNPGENGFAHAGYGGNGGKWGGGGGGNTQYSTISPGGGSFGAVRIIWSPADPSTRVFPSTNIGDV